MLLTSVFGPYARDDEYGSRSMNPMELYQNQVTREQGIFSLRMFHRSWGMMMIHQNINAPAVMLDFPTRERFIEEITTREYDVVGIGAIIPNVRKVAEMCRLIREHQPQATIVVGGHVANIPDIYDRVDADHVVRGEGVEWMRKFLGQSPEEPLRHPRIYSGIGARTLGVPISEKPGEVAATVIPSVGCPVGCNFCATSAMFGGKGNCIHFYPEGDDLFKVMCELERDMKVKSFFAMDENFLLHRKRALRLLELMEQHDKSWALYVFSSANVLRSYTIEQLVGLGISWVWMGLEGKGSQYAKLARADTQTLVKTLQENGIRVLGSTIIGLEEHTPENIDEAIEWGVSHNTDFHQFMLYTPIPGTALHAKLKKEEVLLPETELQLCDTHGQYRFNYKHPHIKAGQETEFLRRAFKRDFEVNGPSIIRLARTLLKAWKKYKNHPDPRIRRRYQWEVRDMPVIHAGVLWAARRWYRNDPRTTAMLKEMQAELYAEFGIKSRIAAPLAGMYIHRKMKAEQKRLNAGWTYEPPTFYELNEAAKAPAAAKPSAGLSLRAN